MKLFIYIFNFTEHTHKQSCKKRKTLHDPEICIENFTQDFISTLFPKITRCPSKAKNYRTTKKKGSAFTPPIFPEITTCPSKAKIFRTTKKKGSASFYITQLFSK